MSMIKYKKEGEAIPMWYLPTRVMHDQYKTIEFYPLGIHWIARLYYNLMEKESLVWGNMKGSYNDGYKQAQKDLGQLIDPTTVTATFVTGTTTLNDK